MFIGVASRRGGDAAPAAAATGAARAATGGACIMGACMWVT